MTTSATPGAAPDARPRFRTDLVAEPIQDGAHRFVDVFDPDSGRGFRFYEVEYSLACAMDGERDVAGLVRWAKEELGVEPSARELATVISTLGELGYLAGERVDVGGLAPGVIAGRQPVAPAAEQVELGTAGGVAAAGGELPHVEMELGQAGGVSAPHVVVDDFGTGPELGPSAKDEFPAPPPAAMPVAALRPRSVPDSDIDGPTDLPRPVPLAAGDEDVSTDLSDHLAISAMDVKEAVRASKVMQAVELPADIAATLAAAEAEQEARAAEAAKAVADRAAAEQAAASAAAKAAADAAERERAAAEKEAAAQAAAARAAQAVVRPVEPSTLGASGTATAQEPVAAKPAEERKPAEEKKPAEKKPEGKKPEVKPTDTATAKLPPKEKVAARPVEAPAEPRTSRALIALLVITILLAGTYLVWTQILKKPLPWEKTETAATQPAPQPQPAPAPPPPPPPSAVLTEVPGAPVTVGANQVGTIAEIVEDGSTIAEGGQLARFVGNPGIEKRLAATKRKLDVDLAKTIADLTAKRDAAAAAGKADAVKAWQDKLDKQLQTRESLEAEVTSLTDQLGSFIVHAPRAGTVKTEVARGAKITDKEQPIATITEPPSLEAKFTMNPGDRPRAVGDSARIMGKGGGQAITCDVTAVEGSTITVHCPGGSVPAGVPVILQ